MYQTPTTNEDTLFDRLGQLADDLAEHLTQKADLVQYDLSDEIQTLRMDTDVQLGLVLDRLDRLEGMGDAVEEIRRLLLCHRS